MKRLKGFLFILFLGVPDSQLNAMEPISEPIFEGPVERVEDPYQDPSSEEYQERFGNIPPNNQANPGNLSSSSEDFVSSVPVSGRDNLPITNYTDGSTASAIDVDPNSYVPTLTDLKRGIVNADSVQPTFEETMQRVQNHKAVMRQGLKERGYDPSSPANPEVAQAHNTFKDDWAEIRNLPREQQQQARDNLRAKQKAELQRLKDERDAAHQSRLDQMRSGHEESRRQAERERVIQKSNVTVSRSEEITKRIMARKRAKEEKQQAKDEEALRLKERESINALEKSVEENNLRVELEEIQNLSRGDGKKEAERKFLEKVGSAGLDSTTKRELKRLLFLSKKQDVSSLRSTIVDRFTNEIERVENLQLSSEELRTVKMDLLKLLHQSNISTEKEGTELRSQILSMGEPLEIPVVESPASVDEIINEIERVKSLQLSSEELLVAKKNLLIKLGQSVSVGPERNELRNQILSLEEPLQSLVNDPQEKRLDRKVTEDSSRDQIGVKKEFSSGSESFNDQDEEIPQVVETEYGDSLAEEDTQSRLIGLPSRDDSFQSDNRPHINMRQFSISDNEEEGNIAINDNNNDDNSYQSDNRPHINMRQFSISDDDSDSDNDEDSDSGPDSDSDDDEDNDSNSDSNSDSDSDSDNDSDTNSDDDTDSNSDDDDLSIIDNEVLSGHSDIEEDRFSSNAGEEDDDHSTQGSGASYSDMKEARQINFKKVMDKADDRSKKQFIVTNLESDIKNINNLLQSLNPSDEEIKYVALSVFQDGYFINEMTAKQLKNYTTAVVEFGNKYSENPLIQSEYQEVKVAADTPLVWRYGSDTNKNRESSIDVDDVNTGSETENENPNYIQLESKKIPQQRALTFFEELISLPPSSVSMGTTSNAYALNQGTILNPQIAAQVNKVTSMENLLAKNIADKKTDSSMESEESFYSTKIKNARQQQNQKEAVQLLADLEDVIVNRPIAPLNHLPKTLQEDADVTSFIESSKTQRIALEKYFGIQSLFTQQAMSVQPLAVTALSTGQLSPQQTIQLTNALQTLTAQENQLKKEQGQVRRDISTLKSLNTEIIQKLDTYINVLDKKEFDSQTQQEVTQIKRYQKEISSEQNRLKIYLEGLDSLSAHNREVTEFYFEVLDKMKREELSSEILKEEVLASPQILQEEKRYVEDSSYEVGDESDEEDYPDALDENKEEKECANNIKKVMSLEAQLSNVLDQLHELQELLIADSDKLRLTIRDAVETIIGKPSRYVEDARYSINSFSDMTNLITRGKDRTGTHEVLTVQQKEKIAMPFNKIGKSLAHLEKEIKSIQATIRELQKDHPQTSDKPVCQTLARMLNQLQKRLNGAKTVMAALREQNALDLDLIQMS